MTVNESLDKTQKRLLDFFFPRKCPFCGRMTGRELLCSRCKTELPRQLRRVRRAAVLRGQRA